MVHYLFRNGLIVNSILLWAATAGASFSPQPSTLSDPQAATILKVLNESEIEVSKLAIEKATTKEVQSFATHMIKSHGELGLRAAKLFEKLAMSLQETKMSEKLRLQCKQTQEKLSRLTGVDFDKEFMRDAVKMHEMTIKTADRLLVPSVRNEAFKRFLIEIRPELVKHLELARAIAKKIGA